MIDRHSYVFVLGAGASAPYQFPIGSTLYEDIRTKTGSLIRPFTEEYKQSYPRLSSLNIQAEELVKEMGTTSASSIDKYLNVNKKFGPIGVIAIASAIYNSERGSKRPNLRAKCDGDWYNYLFDKMTEELLTADDFLRVYENRISFVTFNYDRSLENFLYQNLWSWVRNAGKSQDQVAEAIMRIPIVHVFGKVGHLPWELGIYEEISGLLDATKKVVNFGDQTLMPGHVGYKMQSEIKLMHDERVRSEDLNRVHDMIAAADRVMFLGFGYAKENLDLLRIPDCLDGKQVYGTAFGMIDNEIKHIKNSKLGFQTRAKVKGNSEIYNCDCLELLRRHLL